MSDDIIKDAIALRRYLHQHPEVSCEERETSRHLKTMLEKDCEPDELLVFEQYGLAAVYQGQEPGKTIMIRGDFDALPIEEENDFEHKSVNEGVSHKCGHDGHASILYALARRLKSEGLSKGKAILLFQPAEENGEGAKGMINDPKFAQLKPDFVVALHNLPGYPKHTVVWKKGTFTAAANSIIIRLKGKTSHAAEPEAGINPALAMAEITEAILKANIPDLESNDFRIATPIYSTLGEKSYGVSAGYGELHFTLRAWTNDVMKEFEEFCESKAKEIGEQHGLKIVVDWTQHFFANENNDEIIDAVKQVAAERDYPLEERSTAFKWGEDFGIFTDKFPGAMFGLGAGEDSPALHNPDYDFPDEILQTGADMFYQLIYKLQG
ncbi:amidohydrolase [Marinoscillum furvescens]|uniref:Amidohydrolase n=1 Tax=Marinoscillum furvescens DSM 4134 TaxID=1122208 RepID=A0A3D9L1X6_MARFU|nr:amidohydrolase [Marinoscillum furvescens]RED96223.1 amidohydrolase [Marinoscillum furvescens DSM 4134]